MTLCSNCGRAITSGRLCPACMTKDAMTKIDAAPTPESKLLVIQKELAKVKAQKAQLEADIAAEPVEPSSIPPKKVAAADRVLTTLARDPELLEAVRQRFAQDNPVEDNPAAEEPGVLEDVLAILKEGQQAFDTFCKRNGIVGGTVFNHPNPSKSRHHDAWKAFMRDEATPRNVRAAKILVSYFEGHLPAAVGEFCEYVDEYQDLITDWDQGVPDAPLTTGRNFPTGLESCIEAAMAERSRQHREMLQTTFVAYAILMVKHEFVLDHDEGWTLFRSEEKAKAHKAEKGSYTRDATGQFFSYEGPTALKVEHKVWVRLGFAGPCHSKSNPLPKPGTVITMEMVRWPSKD